MMTPKSVPSGAAQTVVALLFMCGTAAAQPSGEHGNLQLPAREVERRMEREPFVIDDVDDVGSGVMGARKLELDFPDGVEFDAKWKEGASGGEGWNNAPRREIAAYRVQQLFLDPDDFLVPPVVARCIPFDVYRPVDDDPQPAFDGTHCAFGTLSAWLTNITEPDRAFDPKRFSTDRRYAYHFANLNLLTYLINHRDARKANLLMSKDEANPQVFSVDNGIAFGGVLYNFFTWHLDQFRVGGLPRQSIDRLRQTTPADWQRLAVVAQLRVDAGGILRPEPAGPPSDPKEGNRWVDGVLQLGLTAEEIAAVEQRAVALLREVDEGTVTVF
jgi:hypothetical protein